MKPVLLAILAVAALTQNAPADHDLSIAVQYPVVGEAQTVTLRTDTDAAGVTLSVTYRPNSATEDTMVIGKFDADGRISWCPEEPGITSLIAKDAEGKTLATLNVATCFSSTPYLGLVVMVFAGILLFGGAAISLVMALRRMPEEG